jgi:hypothetical protein
MNLHKVVQGKCLKILRFNDSHAICKSKSETKSANLLSTEKNLHYQNLYEYFSFSDYLELINLEDFIKT